MARKKSLTEAVSSELQSGFDLNKFKEKKLLKSNVKFKELTGWTPQISLMEWLKND
jgi:hypothetical protein